MTDEDILREAIVRIRHGFQPRRMILFGSRASSQAQPDSDFDFVILVDEPVDVHDLAGRIRLALRDLPASFDILVRTASEWDRWERVPVTMQYRIARQGRIVYDRAA